MSEDLYEHICDEALDHLNSAEKLIRPLVDVLLAAGHPGVRFSNRKATEIIGKIREAKKLLDELPAEIKP